MQGHSEPVEACGEADGADNNGTGLGTATAGVSASSMEQIYQQIMLQKKAEDTATRDKPSPRGTAATLGVSLRGSTFERLLSNVVDDGQPMMRSNTMANILHTLTPNANDLDDLMFDWSSLPQDKFLEGLNNDMRDIGNAPPDVGSMRRTFTFERMLSGPQSELQAMVEAAKDPQGLASGAYPSALIAGVLGESGQERLRKRARLAGLPDGPSSSGANSAGCGLTQSGGGACGAGGVGGAPNPSFASSQTLLNIGGLQHRLGARSGPYGIDLNGHAGGGSCDAGGARADLHMSTLQNEADRLARENKILQQQLDVILGQIAAFQEENNVMKDVILQACATKGISADLPQLNQTLALHRPPPISDDAASRLAAAVLTMEQGDTMRSMQVLFNMAMQRMHSDPRA